VEGSQGITSTGAFLGTIDYVAPEQARGDAVDARTDVYSLGCVLFQALTGSVPYPLDNDVAKLYAHDAQPPPSVLERAPDVPAAFEPVLARAMAKAPGDRYPSAGDLGRAALAAASGTAAPSEERSVATGDAAPVEAGAARTAEAGSAIGPQPSAPTGPGAPWYRRPLAVGGLLTALVAAVVVVILLASGGGGSSNTGTTGAGAGTNSGAATVAANVPDRDLAVVAARTLRTHGHVLRIVLSRLRLPAAAQAGRRDPHFLTLFVRDGGAPFVRIQRLRLPWLFTASSTLNSFSLTPNGDGSGNIALSWIVGAGNANGVTHYLTVTPSGLTIDS
jgi:protein kinase-like protein